MRPGCHEAWVWRGAVSRGLGVEGCCVMRPGCHEAWVSRGLDVVRGCYLTHEAWVSRGLGVTRPGCNKARVSRGLGVTRPRCDVGGSMRPGCHEAWLWWRAAT